MKKKLILSFAPEIVDCPVIYHLVKDCDLIVNILKAEVSLAGGGTLAVIIDGSEENIARGEKFLRDSNVEVTDWKNIVVRDENKCTHCGACLSVCAHSLKMNRETWQVEFNEEECIDCRYCINACPSRAMSIVI